MKLQVPYFSQLNDVENADWQDRACTIANLKMVLEYYSAKSAMGAIPSIDALIEEGIEIHAYEPSVGWSHEGVVRLARNHGINAYAQEFRSMTIDRRTGSASPSIYSEKLFEEGLGKIAHHVEEGHPVIVSVLPGFGNNNGYHTVLVVGVEHDVGDVAQGFWCLDPFLERTEGEKPVSIPLEKFKSLWRRLAIFVY